MFTQASYKQVKIKEEEKLIIMFKTNDKDNLGVITLPTNPNYHHFEFTVQHPKEGCSISIFHKGKPIDYQIFTLNALPIAEEADTLQIPLKFPLSKDSTASDKETLFLKFDTISFAEDEITSLFSSGVFILQRVKASGYYRDLKSENLNMTYSKK